MKRGDVFWAELTPRSGSEQSGSRPVIIVSHNGFNQTSNWRSITVVPVSTSGRQEKRALTVLPLPKDTAALAQARSAVCHQVTTLDRAKLARRLGALPASILVQVEQSLKAAMDLE
jgi:mRNA interferase MazF